MYERRLKVFLGILIAITATLLVRCAQLQIVDGQVYQEKAARSMRRPELIETTRGSILDLRGRELAVDEPCLAASVDYRAITRDEQWMKEQARIRLAAAYRGAGRAERSRLLEQELARLNKDLDLLWRTLAEVSGKSLEEIEQLKAALRRRVEMRKRYVWYKRYEDASQRHQQSETEPWFREWLLSGDGAPQIDSFAIDVAEESEPHVILSNISTEVHNRLAKQLDQFPGLVLARTKHRLYPLGEVACHLLGHLTAVDSEDLKQDPNPEDELKRYFPSDRVGRGGIEELCEQTLRGRRGRREWIAGERRLISSVNPLPGKDVRITIDIDLQVQIEHVFQNVKLPDGEEHEMHGAAVVLDVPTGQVRALVSHPTFDANRFAELYPVLRDDAINKPLLNRATQLAVEPGSTVKPIVGIGAVTQGLIRTDQGIECTGYLIINGKRYPFGRCWTASKYAGQGIDVAHHKLPSQDPHPDGHLIFSDALQRSCNVYFETLGDRLKIQGLAYWFGQFGLGRKTGIGIAEWPGWVPGDRRADGPVYPSVQWFSAIGQTQVAATPIQMANVAATIARDGTWLRPRLVVDDSDVRPIPSTQPTEPIPDEVKLKVSPAAMAAAKQGMGRVVNTRAGTGRSLHDPQLVVAGKTGTAEVPPLRITLYDENHRPLRDEQGRIQRWSPRPSTVGNRNLDMLWYRGGGKLGTDLSHAWFIGFAPKDKPQIAFAVLLEYGGSGGTDAGVVAKAVLEACKEHGYLRAGK